MARLTVAALLGASVGGCGAHYAAPAVGEDEIQAARLSIVAAPLLTSNGRSMQESAAMLDRVVRRVVAAAQPLCAAQLDRPCNFDVKLGPSKAPQAEALSGGQISVTLGMMDILDNEDEVAVVVGHEFGHQLAGHIDRQLARSMAAGTGASAVLGALVPLGGLAGWALGQGAAELGAGAVRLAFSKSEEREADYLAAYLVARAGYDLDRAGQVWAKFTRSGSQQTKGMLDSHPAEPDRLAAWRRATDEIRRSLDLIPRRTGS